MPPKAKPVRSSGVTRVAVVVSRYNSTVTDRLLAGALEVCGEGPGGAVDAHVVDAPGSFELPVLALAAARTGRFRGVLALGCIIRGGTDHDRYLAEAVAHGLTSVSLETGVPVAFGVLTVRTARQALQRVGLTRRPVGHKGREAMSALLEAIRAVEMLQGRGRSRRDREGAAPERPDKAAPRRGTRRRSGGG